MLKRALLSAAVLALATTAASALDSGLPADSSVALASVALTGTGPAAEPEPAAPGENVRAVTGKALKQALAGYKGKPVLLNLWATWCAPCVEEFPDLVKLQQKYRDQGLVVIAASIDEPKDRAKVVEFVRAQKAEFPIFARSGGSIDAFVNPIDREWGGAVPTTYLFDASGRQHGKPIVGSRTLAQFEAAVKPLLK